MAPVLKIEAPLNPHALRIIRELPGVEAEPRADGRLRIDGRKLELDVEYKRRVGAADAWQVVWMVQQYPKRAPRAALVVADQTTGDARRILAEHGIGYIDGLGNAHLEYPGTYVHVETPRSERSAQRRPQGELRLAGKAGVAAQALLLEPTREWRVTDLAERAKVSVGLAHAVLARLEHNGMVEARGDRRAKARVLTKPAALLDLWAEENRDRGVTRQAAYLLPLRGRDIAEAAAQHLHDAKVDHALTGVVAAARLAPFVTALPAAEFWIDAAHPLDELVRRLEAERADQGANLVLMQAADNLPLAFTGERQGVQFANVFRIYLDARGDPKRGREQAEHFRREVIGW